ncbi:MAG: YkgJ family cysteine cluster protein [Flavobacteriaceae bacterium]|nr:YkgJ family cysteine cluster protein [Flavobacteriaceae bacterium]
MISLDNLPHEAAKVKQENAKYLKKLKVRKPKQLDAVMGELHVETFQKIDCLSCGNCCKTTGPMFISSDIKQISKRLKMRPLDFETTYLRTDEDGDKVLQEVPCPFLDVDNYCSIYEDRPKACREFPHTDRPKFHQITQITAKNVAVCPAVFSMVERLKATLPL